MQELEGLIADKFQILFLGSNGQLNNLRSFRNSFESPILPYPLRIIVYCT